MVEPVTATLGILSSVLSIASSIRKLVDRGQSRQEALQSYISNANDNERILLKPVLMQNAVLQMTTISGKLLDQLAAEASDCEITHIDLRRQAKSQIEKDEADSKAAACMCSVLRSIMRHNAMQLPVAFKDWWDSYRCTP